MPQRLTCCYHGWSFDTDGTLVTVPVPEGCGEGFDKEAFGLARVPRVGEYRGFVFASLAARGPSFEDHIGPMKGNIDDLVDRAPDGALALDAGMHRYVFNGNWKLQVENVLDSYHVPFGHASTVNKEGRAVRAARRRLRKAPRSSRPRRSKTARVLERPQELHRRQWPRLDQQHRARRWQAVEPGLRRIQARAGGKSRRRARASEILTPRLHNSLIYPNMSIMGLEHPRARHQADRGRPHRGERLSDPSGRARPTTMNFGNIRLLNVTHSAASFVQTDDLESFVRAQKGLRSHADRLGRHLARARRRGARPRAQRHARARPPTRWWCARNTRPGSATCDEAA